MSYICNVCHSVNCDNEPVCTECMAPKDAICESCGSDIYTTVGCGNCLEPRENILYHKKAQTIR